MDHFSNTPFEQNARRESLLRDLSLVRMFFFGTLLLPFLVAAGFYMGIFESKGAQLQDELQKAVALLTTPTGSGTAFLISPDKLLTARHVVENVNVGETLDVLFDRISPSVATKVKLIWKDQSPSSPNTPEYFQTDAAILELVNPNDAATITPLVLGDSDPVRPLEKVILIGYPDGDFSVTTGTINNEKPNGLDLFKLDATANPGNSGGPCLLESDNSVIGILVGSKVITDSENIANKINNIRAIAQKNGISLD